MADKQELMIPCSFQAKGGTKQAFAVREIRETYGRRIIPRVRVYKDGAKLDDTGEDAIAWEIDAIFLDGNSGPEAAGAELDQYPNALDALCIELRKAGTGDLALATRGPRRARLKSWRRVDSADFRNGAVITLSFLEDSEDDITAAAFAKPGAKTVASSIASATFFYAEASGALPDLFQSLAELSSQLQELANSPGEFVDSLEAKANAIVHQCSMVESTFAQQASRANNDVAALLSDPSSAPALRHLRQLSDVARRATLEAAQASAAAGNKLSRIVSRTYPRTMSIFDIASIEEQDASALMGMNGAVADFFEIPAGTPIRVVDQAA